MEYKSTTPGAPFTVIHDLNACGYRLSCGVCMMLSKMCPLYAGPIVQPSWGSDETTCDLMNQKED